MTAARRGGKRVGYVRAVLWIESRGGSWTGQVDKVFTDKACGKDVNRAQLQAALDYLREGDVLVVHSMDRLA